MTKKKSKIQAGFTKKYADDEGIKMASGAEITIGELKDFIKSESLTPQDLFDEDFLAAYMKDFDKDKDPAGHIPD